MSLYVSSTLRGFHVCLFKQPSTDYVEMGNGIPKEREVDKSERRDVSRVGTESVSNKYFEFLPISQKMTTETQTI